MTLASAPMPTLQRWNITASIALYRAQCTDYEHNYSYRTQSVQAFRDVTSACTVWRLPVLMNNYEFMNWSTIHQELQFHNRIHKNKELHYRQAKEKSCGCGSETTNFDVCM